MRSIALLLALLLPLAGCLDLLDSDDNGANQPPTAYITMPGQGATVEVDQPFQLVGYGEDPDGEDSRLGYVWTLSGLGAVIELSRLASDMVTVSQTGPDLVLTLTVTDPHGASTSDVKLITVEPGNRPPTAVIRLPVAGSSYSEGQPVQFDGRTSSDPDGDTLRYLWELGEQGGSKYTASQQSNFERDLQEGEYEVQLTVEDPDGEVSTAMASFSITNLPPVAVASADATTVFVGEEISFDGDDSYDPEGDVLDSSWSFGDGDTSTLRSPKHIWDAPGSYTVNLTVEDGRGQQGSALLNIEVETLGPDALFSFLLSGDEVNEVRAGTNLTLDASSSSSPNGAITNYSWDFGDGTSETGENDTSRHSWATGGWFNVTLTVSDSADESAELVMQLRVIPENFQIDYSGSQAIIISNSDDQYDFPVEVFLDGIYLNLTVSCNTGSMSYELKVLDASGAELWAESGALGGGDSENHPVAVSGNATGDYIITIQVDNGGITPTGASWEFQGWVRYS
jgi:PKD repeat protein